MRSRPRALRHASREVIACHQRRRAATHRSPSTRRPPSRPPADGGTIPRPVTGAAEPDNVRLLPRDIGGSGGFVARNCPAVLEASHAFGGRMVERGRGGVVLVTSGAAWAGGATLAVYSATKAFDANLAESLWA